MLLVLQAMLMAFWFELYVPMAPASLGEIFWFGRASERRKKLPEEREIFYCVVGTT